MKRPTPLPAAAAVANRALVLGGVTVALGAVMTLMGLGVMGALPAAFGAVLLWSGFVTRSSSVGAESLNRAWDATSRGRLAEAHELLDGLTGTYQFGYLRQAADLCLARIAFRRGDLPEALRCSSAAAGRRLGVLGRSYARVGRVNARALRAVVRAAMGDAAGARDDADFVRARAETSADAAARAELAEALLLDQAGDRGALGAHLARHAQILSEHTTPRERAIVRAYERLIEARRGSVYREAAPREPVPAKEGEPTVEDWISKLAPAAAPFARVGRPDPASAGAPAIEVDPALQRAAAARLAAKSGSGRRAMAPVLGLWVLLIMFFLVIWQFLSPAGAADEEVTASTSTFLVTWLPCIFLAVLAAVFYYRFGGGDRQAMGVLAATRRAARGERDEADRALQTLAKSRFPLVSARAYLELAFSAERRAFFAEALDLCDRGLAAASSSANVRAVAGSFLLPELLGERSIILVASGRDAEADAEMAHLAGAFPGHPFLARAERRFEVLRRARGGDLAGAADLAADDSCDAPLPARDELLGDLARAAVRPGATRPDEVARIERVLRDDPDARRWIDAAAPAALSGFVGRGKQAAPEEEAEREALAEEEALAVAGAVRR